MNFAAIAVLGALSPSGSPFVLLLDRQGTIVYEGGLESVEWWDTLAVTRP